MLPVCYGDALFGMWKGFEELKALGWIDRMPRLVAAEVSGSLTAAMASGEPMPPDRPRNARLHRHVDRRQPGHRAGARSAAAQRRRRRHDRRTTSCARWVVTLGAKEGIWPEPSSAAPFAAIERLRASGVIAPDERAVALLTASGLKDTSVDRERLAAGAGRERRPRRGAEGAARRLWFRRMAEFGISMDGRAPIADIPAQARAAEEGGASTLWIACHLYLRDPVTMAALALGATRRIKVALMAMSPYSMHPVFIAMAAASLEEMYPGRVILCLGVGAPADLKAAGIDSPRPLVTLAEAIAICRSLLAGEMADFQGQVFGVVRPAPGQRRRATCRSCSRPRAPTCCGSPAARPTAC